LRGLEKNLRWEGEIDMETNRKSFIIKELKAVELSGWGAEYGAIEKVFFDAKIPTIHSSTGITICTGGEKSKIPMHYHNCETSHYILYGNGVMKSADGNKHRIKPGVLRELTILKMWTNFL